MPADPGSRPALWRQQSMAGVVDSVADVSKAHLVLEDHDVAAVRRLFGQYRRAVEGYASASDVCA